MKQNHPSDINKQGNQKHESRNYGSLAVKILCVLAAFVLWVYVMAVESPEQERTFNDVIVELKHDDVLRSRGLSVHSINGNKDETTVVNITLSGKRSQLSKLESSDIKAYIDLGEKEVSGQSVCPILVEPIEGCEVAAISEESVYIYVDKKISKEVEIRTLFKNLDLPEGYKVGSFDLGVDNISVKGAERIVDSIDYAKVVFDFEGVTETRVLSADVVMINYNETDQTESEVVTSHLEFENRTFTLEIPIVKKVDVPVEIVFKHGFFDESNAEISISPEIIEVTGDPQVIDSGNLILPIVVDEKLDFDEDGVYSKTVTRNPPAGLTYSDDTIEIKITRGEDIRTRDITVRSNNIIGTNAPGNVNYEIARKNIEVTVMGPRDAVAGLDPDDITLILNLSGYDETVKGEFEVEASVSIDSEVADEIIELGKYTVDVMFYE